jgi:penicillin-binding protein 1A
MYNFVLLDILCFLIKHKLFNLELGNLGKVKKNKVEPKKGKLLNRLLTAAFLLLSGAGIGMIFLMFKYHDLPTGQTVKGFQPSRVSYVKYKGQKGEKNSLYNSYNGCYMENLPEKKITKKLKVLMTNSEDSSFYSHIGVNPTSIARAAIANYKAGSVVEGASTIDIQTAEQMLISIDPTYASRNKFDKKLREILFAIKLNANYMTKDEILNTYLQIVPIYRNMCGVTSYAREMLGKEPDELTLNEMVTLISSLPGPYLYDPIENPLKAIRKRNQTIEQIAKNATENNTLNAYEILELKSLLGAPLPNFKKPTFANTGTSSWVSQTTKTELTQNYLPSQITNRGYSIESTFEPNVQKVMEDRMRGWNRSGMFGANWEVSMLTVDADNYGILGVVGSREEFGVKNQFNLAIDSRAQSGSTGKIAVYATNLQHRIDEAIANGKKASSANLDTIYVSRPGWRLEGPVNKTLSITKAFAMSVNTAAVSALVTAGDDKLSGGQRMLNLYKQFGVTFPDSPGDYGYINPKDPTIALGTYDVSMLELLTIPSAIVNGGKVSERMGLYRTPFTTVKNVTDADGNLIYSSTNDSKKQVLYPEVSNKMREAMRAVVQEGTGKKANQCGLDVIGKTGTTDKSSVVAFVGSTKINGRNIITMIRIKHKKNYGLGSSVYGGTFVAPLVGSVFCGIANLPESEQPDLSKKSDTKDKIDKIDKADKPVKVNKKKVQ